MARWKSKRVCMASAIGLAACVSIATGQTSDQLVSTGQVLVNGRAVNYRVRHLPVNSFPDLPGPIAAELTRRGCLIPQTYEAHRPENVIHGRFERPDSLDWAVLCSVQGQVSLLVFFSSGSPDHPITLAAAAETERVQAHTTSDELGFNWGIDPASPRRVHEAQTGMRHRPEPPDHDSIANTTLDRKTVYYLYRNGSWEKIEVED